ncbi:MAG: rhomboid family intramembrane serine protease [Chloroflexota bacterium]|nr:rhomboid family intramembrane serine protease [Chloroflexota bacterium]
MLNEPSTNPGAASNPPPKRHPLEDRPARPTPDGNAPNTAPRQQIMLHIPTVKPTFTLIFIGAMVVIFVIRALSPVLDVELFLWGANHQPDVFGKGEFYRLFTSMFLHSSIYAPDRSFALQNSLHLVFNAYILFVSGGSVERFFGHWRFKIIFVLGGLTGSILSVVLNPSAIYSVGASGAVFAILGAEFVYIYKHRKLLGARGRAQMQNLIIMGVLNLVLGVLSSASPAGMRIDNWAHIGGALGGLLLGWIIAPDLLFKRHPTIPNELMATDRNPLRLHARAISLYLAAMVSVLIVASQVVM